MASKQLILTLLIVAAQNYVSFGQVPATDSPPAPAPAPTPEPAPTVPALKCSKSGFMCSDCNNQAVCIEQGSGQFKQIKNRCPADSHCLNDTCVKGGKCNAKAFECADEGFFPDPYDCTKYHVCMRNNKINSNDGKDEFQSIDTECGPGRGSFDATAGNCGFAMNSTACMKGPVPRCTVSLQIGALEGHPSFYYVCTENEDSLGPMLYRCPGGKVFDTVHISCTTPTKKKA